MAFQDITPVITCPNVANATSVPVLAANPNRKGLRIQNNTAATIAWSEAGFALTGVTPTLANPCEQIVSGSYYESPAGNVFPVSTSAITVYQTTGASTNLISVVER